MSSTEGHLKSDCDIAHHSECASATSAQLIQDWAVWAVITLTGVNEAAQHVNDRPMSFHAGRDGLPVALGQDANLTARSSCIAPKPEQLPDLLDREAKRSSALDEAQLVHVALVEGPVTIRVPAGGAQQSYALVIPEAVTMRIANAARLSGVPAKLMRLTFQPLERLASQMVAVPSAHRTLQ